MSQVLYVLPYVHACSWRRLQRAKVKPKLRRDLSASCHTSHLIVSARSNGKHDGHAVELNNLVLEHVVHTTATAYLDASRNESWSTAESST